MTVNELIKELQKIPDGNMEVVCHCDGEWCYHYFDEVYVGEDNYSSLAILSSDKTYSMERFKKYEKRSH